MTTELKPPIILFGNHRSGTTITQKLIGLHPDVVTWYEPRTLWRYADPGRRHDEFDESDATEKVVRYIRSRFLKYQLRYGNRRIMENTPSNVLRVPYVNAIFPEAVYLYITRNPFSVISSMEYKWKKTKKWTGLRRSLSDTPITQLHYYAKDFFEHMFIKRIFKNKTWLFGPRYKGIEQELKKHDKLRVIARQWARGNQKARNDLANVGNGGVFTFRYEDLMEDTETILRRIYDHCGLTCSDDIISAAKKMVDPGRQEKWLRLDPEDLKSIIPEIQSEMEFYGYEIPPQLL